MHRTPHQNGHYADPLNSFYGRVAQNSPCPHTRAAAQRVQEAGGLAYVSPDDQSLIQCELNLARRGVRR